MLAIMPLAVQVAGCSQSPSKTRGPCYEESAGRCVPIGTLLIDVGSAGDNATVTYSWNPLGFGYAVRDPAGIALVFVAQSGRPNSCLQMRDGGDVRSWAVDPRETQEERTYREVSRFGKLVQREVTLKLVAADKTLRQAVVACTAEDLDPAKLPLALKILDSIQWQVGLLNRE